MRDGEGLAGLAFLALGALVVAGSLTMPLGSAVAPGPGFVPLVVGSGIVVAGAAALARRSTIGENASWPDARGAVRLAKFMALVAAYVGLTPVVGFSVATFLFTLVAVRWLTPYSRASITALAAVLTAVVHLVFRTLLALPLPRGTLGLF